MRFGRASGTRDNLVHLIRYPGGCQVCRGRLQGKSMLSRAAHPNSDNLTRVFPVKIDAIQTIVCNKLAYNASVLPLYLLEWLKESLIP